MAASTGNYVCDNSTLANFKSWAQAISTAIAAGGWTQSTDTGQVNWSTISAVPGSGAYVYEIWQPNDGLANFYVKMEYGNFSGTNCPAVRISAGTATNGAGTLSGNVIGPWATPYTSYTAPSTTVTYPCYFAAGAGYLSILLWNGGGNSCAQAFAVERSCDVNGNHTAAHVTVFVAGYSQRVCSSHQTLHLTNGAAPWFGDRNSDSGQIAARIFDATGAVGGSGVFNASLALDGIAPYIGFFDYPLTAVALGGRNSLSSGQIFTSSVYGATRTYVATNSGVLYRSMGTSTSSYLCLRYD
jgi:hypothetical protein